MADSQSAYQQFLTRLKDVDPQRKTLIDNALQTRGKDDYLSEVGKALRQHPNIIPQGQKEATLLSAAEKTFPDTTLEHQQESSKKQSSTKPFSWSDILNKGRGGSSGSGGMPTQRSSFEEDILAIQKAQTIKKLSDAFEKIKTGQVDAKFAVPFLREAVNGLSLEKLLQGQNTILREMASNSDFFKNSQEADKQNFIVGVQKAYTASIDRVKNPQKEDRFQSHPDLAAGQNVLLDKLTATLRDTNNSHRLDEVVSHISRIIDHQHAQLRPILPKTTEMVQQALPDELFSYLASLSRQYAAGWKQYFSKGPVGFIHHTTFIQPQFQRLSAGGLAPNPPTFSTNSGRGKRKSLSTDLVKTAIKAGGKAVKKAAQEGIKKLLQLAIAHPEITVPIILGITAVIAIIVGIAFLISLFIATLGWLGSSIPTTPALTKTCNPSTQCLSQLHAMGINLTGDLYLNGDPYGKAKPLYELLSLVTQPPSKFGTLLGLPKNQITIVLHASGGCAGHASGSGRLDYYGWCGNETVNKFMMLHELGHMIAFRNPSLYWLKFFIPYIAMPLPFRFMPTFNCQFDYGLGPWPAECFADMVGEYVFYPTYRVTVSGRPSGPRNFLGFPDFASRFYYNFARDNIYNGLDFQKLK